MRLMDNNALMHKKTLLGVASPTGQIEIADKDNVSTH
ncbi:hypothetical protein Pan181_19740 [Aeoliella mucimassa]|uniref:Uncharacterized protein n=1 Tax=Aeoliella mucimassa TaxID=2527972 RepID=A0A518AM41_9BACT|nr:hypothetical protein Pan181_19740 [Aeoliella mucimassa]